MKFGNISNANVGFDHNNMTNSYSPNIEIEYRKSKIKLTSEIKYRKTKIELKKLTIIEIAVFVSICFRNIFC